MKHFVSDEDVCSWGNNVLSKKSDIGVRTFFKGSQDALIDAKLEQWTLP